jgi:hypothetical protein
MATPTIDVSFLQYFSPIFVFVLIFVTVYAMLQFTNFMGKNKFLHAIIGILLAIIFMFSGAATTVVMFIAPWFTVLFIFLIFLIMAYKLFGATDDQIKEVITNWSAGQYLIGAVAIVIIIIGLSSALGQDFLGYTQDTGDLTDGSAAVAGIGITDAGGGSTATSDFQQNVVATLFNPKILAMVLILVIGAFTIRAMSSPTR